MKTVLFAGGRGTRIGDATATCPKPLLPVGGRPILRHIMDTYLDGGVDEFIVAVGYLGHLIKRYFVEEVQLAGDVTVDFRASTVRHDAPAGRVGTVRCIDTGDDTQTGGRLGRVRAALDEGEPFCLTYGDGVANVDVAKLLAFHKSHGKLATVTAVHPPARFGEMDLDGDRVRHFAEKPQTREGWINGGFMVLEPGVVDLVDGDSCVFETDVLPRLADDDQLRAFRHEGFWQCVDTPRELQLLNRLCAEHAPPPWRVYA